MGSQYVREWISKSEKDIDEAQFLFENKRPMEDVAFFIHQAIEKSLNPAIL